MKKKLLSLAIAAIAISSLAPLSAFAQAPAVNDGCPASCDCKAPTKARKDRKAHNPFAGVEGLTAEQQTKLDALRAERQKTREARRAANRQARAERQKADSATRAARREARQADRNEYLAQVKSILTPEQYTAWLENMAFKADGHKGRGFKGDRKGNRADRKGRKGHDKGRAAERFTAAVCPAIAKK